MSDLENIATSDKKNVLALDKAIYDIQQKVGLSIFIIICFMLAAFFTIVMISHVNLASSLLVIGSAVVGTVFQIPTIVNGRHAIRVLRNERDHHIAVLANTATE